MPVVVRDATSAASTYLVDARTARTLLPGPELDVVELFPGRALLSVACIDYRDNDLGDYNEVSLAFFVRERRAAAGIPYLGHGARRPPRPGGDLDLEAPRRPELHVRGGTRHLGVPEDRRADRRRRRRRRPSLAPRDGR
jgi:hypothetical protein